MSNKRLFKTTITIYTDYDPTNEVELVDLAQEATDGNAICDVMEAKPVSREDTPEGVLSFFNDLDDDG